MRDAYPELTVVLAHMGGWKQWDEILEALAGRRSRLRVAARATHRPAVRRVAGALYTGKA